MAESREPRAAGPPTSSDDDFDAFYAEQFPRIVAWARVLTGDLAVGEELAQEAMVRAHRHWERVRHYDLPVAWVRKVTTNLASSARRRRAAERAAVERLGALRSIPVTEPDVDEFWSVVRALPRRQRDAVMLFYLEDRPVAEIATELGCAPNTVKAHLHKARRRLARELEIEP